jgi:hypothetical protein
MTRRAYLTHPTVCNTRMQQMMQAKRGAHSASTQNEPPPFRAADQDVNDKLADAQRRLAQLQAELAETQRVNDAWRKLRMRSAKVLSTIAGQMHGVLKTGNDPSGTVADEESMGAEDGAEGDAARD